tara:strand:+ start:1123 stop:1548 length:426 start_codon:yes stop_codon:yes gene_type:complete
MTDDLNNHVTVLETCNEIKSTFKRALKGDHLPLITKYNKDTKDLSHLLMDLTYLAGRMVEFDDGEDIKKLDTLIHHVQRQYEDEGKGLVPESHRTMAEIRTLAESIEERLGRALMGYMPINVYCDSTRVTNLLKRMKANWL